MEPSWFARWEELGYEIDETEITFWGRCPDCANTRRNER
jgi:Fe2+ or Zn2+ uptake regulation protein